MFEAFLHNSTLPICFTAQQIIVATAVDVRMLVGWEEGVSKLGFMLDPADVGGTGRGVDG